MSYRTALASRSTFFPSNLPSPPAAPKSSGKMGKEEVSDSNEKNEQPPGGRDKTPLGPSGEQTYTVKITFHSIKNLPVSDVGKRSSDPYILAQINANVGRRNDHDPFLRFRSQTFHRDRDPEVNSTWTVAGVPASGMTLKIRVYDEDPDDHDDRLGKLAITTGRLDDKFKLENTYKLSKRGASTRAYTLRWCSTMIYRHKSSHAVISLSIEVLGPTKEEVGKLYTMSTFWRVHYSPIIGRFAGTTTEDDDTGVKRFDFQANELQLQGPVPNELYHRYVEFKSFVRGMFTGEGLRGRILHKALHHQHERIYTYNESTKYGDLNGPGRDMALQFLDMVHYDEGGRIFTYVITLDGLMRFTETGKEFGIDLLSKHTMHSDVNIYIACSGEFLVRRLQHPDESAEGANQHTHPAEDVPGGPPDDKPPKDPAQYELIIDNDSGTYRPDAELLPTLKSFLEKNFEGLHIVVKDCADKELEKIKDEQRKAKEREARPMVYGQGSDSGSISSSDASDLDDRAEEGGEGPEDSPGQNVKRAAAVFDRPVNAAKHAFK